MSQVFEALPRTIAKALTTNNNLLEEPLHYDKNNNNNKGVVGGSHPRSSNRTVCVAGSLLLLLAVFVVGLVVGSPVFRHALFGTPTKHVAFIGNSIMYYYDLPRSLEIVSNYSIQQNSCLSGAGSLVRMPDLQNGVWNRWRGSGALLYTLNDSDVPDNNYENSFYDNQVWDLGACTMDMLLFGYNHTEAQANHDDFWENYRDAYGVTDDDAWVYDYGSDLDPRLNNPCAQSQAYLDFLNHLPPSDIRVNPYPQLWDYLVLVDRTVGPRYQKSIQAGEAALEGIYLPFLQRTHATPLFLVTHSYWKDRDEDNTTTTGLDRIPEWTVQMYTGYKQYAQFLQSRLPRSQKPKLVNMGMAYLVVYEENLDLWFSLFWTDHKHPSPHGNFLASCLLHHAVYGRVPYESTVIRDDMQSLWNGTRNLMYPRDDFVPFPTKQEAKYLYNVCKRVAGGYIPRTFQAQLSKGQSMYW